MSDRLPVVCTLIDALSLPYKNLWTLVYKPLLVFNSMLFAWLVVHSFGDYPDIFNFLNMLKTTDRSLSDVLVLLAPIIIEIFLIPIGVIMAIDTAIECHRVRRAVFMPVINFFETSSICVTGVIPSGNFSVLLIRR